MSQLALNIRPYRVCWSSRAAERLEATRSECRSNFAIDWDRRLIHAHCASALGRPHRLEKRAASALWCTRTRTRSLHHRPVVAVHCPPSTVHCQPPSPLPPPPTLDQTQNRRSIVSRGLNGRLALQGIAPLVNPPCLAVILLPAMPLTALL